MRELKQNMPEKLAAIDIGSNAIRMVIAEKFNREISVIKKYRIPIRLGEDVFENGQISDKNMKLACKTFKKFKQLTEKQKIYRIKAVGTSALRESKNGKDFIQHIYKKCGIKIDTIDGVEEARLIHLAVKKEILLKEQRALLIDIGGGSVELTFSENSMMSATQSFPFGTVRTLKNLKKRHLTEKHLDLLIAEYLKPLSSFIHSHADGQKIDFAVGTGGNLECLGKLKPELLKKNIRTHISFDELSLIVAILQQMTAKERSEKLGLRPDRADVILPAALIIQAIMRQARIEKILIPYVGLKDGLLWVLGGAS